MGWPELFAEAAERQGCVTPAMALRHGISPRTLRSRGKRESWDRPFPSVWLCPGAPRTRAQRVAAAVLHCHDDALAGGWTAAWLWNAVRTPPNPHEVLLEHRCRPRAHSKVRTLRTRTLVDDEDRTVIDGVPVTTLARTANDLSGRVTRPFLRGVLIDGRHRGDLDLADAEATARRRLPAAGAKAVLDLCWELDAERCESVFEHRARAALRQESYPPPADAPITVDTPTGKVQVDIPWPELGIGIETDGYGSHSSRAHLDKDQRRHNGLLLGRWRVLRLGWWRFESDWASFTSELSALFAQAAGSSGR